MNIPANLRYSKTHEWVKFEDKLAVVGITEFAQRQLGDITFVDLPKPGDRLEEGGEMGAIESVKAASDLYSPVAGSVAEVNIRLEDEPGLINQSPYEEGWLIKVELSGEPQDLLDHNAYEKLANESA